MLWKLLLLIEIAQAAPGCETLIPLNAPEVAALKVQPLMLFVLILSATVATPVLWIMFVAPLVALVALLDRMLLLMFTVAAEAEFRIPVKVPDVAVVYVQLVMVLVVMFTVLPAAVAPMPLSIAVMADVVPPPFTLTVLSPIVTLPLVPAWAKMPRRVLGWFTPPPLLLLMLLKRMLALHWLLARIPAEGFVAAGAPP